MYTQEAISLLINSVGFGQLSDSAIQLDEPNTNGSSNLIFDSFSKLVTPDAILDAIEANLLECNNAQSSVRAIFTKLRRDAAIKTLMSVLDASVDYQVNEDYSSVIDERLNLLIKPYALAVCADALDMMISSKRTNLSQRNVREAFTFLKMELNGAKNDNGKTVSYGVQSKFDFSVSDAQKIIFPFNATVQSGPSW